MILVGVRPDVPNLCTLYATRFHLRCHSQGGRWRLERYAHQQHTLETPLHPTGGYSWTKTNSIPCLVTIITSVHWGTYFGKLTVPPPKLDQMEIAANSHSKPRIEKSPEPQWVHRERPSLSMISLLVLITLMGYLLVRFAK
ncbi:hypothetical protein BU24DRAFT_130947 [Aaosphaeria arxii CBS 175.79]|uniref:Uncharacterized protein n=1 Tax=Aaosphaeria arxii CBS 175.79 TaxID=1450172 RepID=A0A6A5Y451_9PLEO|nr:uncharacterized protein BU24DRAFT_130947 [Aaosphaeria arxii CBS 175.79]KAF2019973.1 hypothetical protein BU24DRAFT_130947 [Aaosphaeria arxii CBS 175.79]